MSRLEATKAFVVAAKSKDSTGCIAALQAGANPNAVDKDRSV
jgi:hypothetical protein